MCICTKVLVCLTALLAILLPTVAEQESIMFNLMRGSTQCFVLTAHSKTKLFGEVSVVHGHGDMQVGFYLTAAATNDFLLRKNNIQHEPFSTRAPVGVHHGLEENSAPADYNLCVFNRALTGGSQDFRKILLSFGTEAGGDEFEDKRGPLEGVATTSNVKEIEKTVRKIQNTVHSVIEEIDHIRNREAALFLITEHTVHRISMMGMISCAAIIVTGVFQIMQTKRELVKHGDRLFGIRNPSQGAPKKLKRSGSFVLPVPQGVLPKLLEKHILPRHKASPEESRTKKS